MRALVQARAWVRTHQHRAEDGRGNEHTVMWVAGRRDKSVDAQEVGVAERVRVRQCDTDTGRHTDSETHDM